MALSSRSSFSGFSRPLRAQAVKKADSKWAKKPTALPPILPFIRPDLAEVAVGERVATFRPVKQMYYPKIGQLFRAHYNRSPLPGEYRCEAIRHVTLGEARKRYWRELGADAPEKVEMLWIPLFGRSTFQEECKGYVYVATRVG